MLFSAGMGIGLVFWGAAEPISHFNMPPYATANETEAAKTHYGIHFSTGDYILGGFMQF